MVEVPTTDDVTESGKSGVTGGLPVGAGIFLGKSLLGPGIGTAAGGIVGASFSDGQTRERTAETAVIMAASEFAGAGASSSSSSSSRGKM